MVRDVKLPPSVKHYLTDQMSKHNDQYKYKDDIHR